MFQFLADAIDQLDLALDQLALDDRNFDRFAIMLVDNVVELTLHQHAKDNEHESRLSRGLDDEKYDLNAIRDALGRRFDAKVRLAKQRGLINAEMADSILYMHGFRNTAYHQGERHEAILHSIAIFYFCCACKILQAYKPTFWSWSSGEKYSHRAKKYLGSMPFKLGTHKEQFSAAFERLESIASDLNQNLNEDLASDMAETIKRVDDAIDFLANDGPEKLTRKKVIIESQAWELAFTDDGRSYAKNHGAKIETTTSLIEWLIENHSWPVKSDPIPSWNSRLKKLEGSETPHVALKRYCGFLQQTHSIRNTIGRAAELLDQHIQEQIEFHRGN